MANLKFSQLPNLTTPVANTIVPVVSGGVNYTSTMANITAFVNTNSGAIAATSLAASGNVTGAYVKGNGSELTNLPAANIVGTVANATYATSAGSATTATTATSATTAGTVTTAAQPAITSVGTLTSLTASGNITGSYFLGNGSQLTGLPATYGNANVATLLASFGSNTISTSGNITGGYILGNGSQLTGLPATYTNSNVTTLLASFGSNTISTTGNVATGNIVATGTMNATGNIQGNYIIGNGSALTGIVASAGAFIFSGSSYANVAAANGRTVIYNGPTTGNIANIPTAPNSMSFFNDPGNNGITLGSDGNINFSPNGISGTLNLSLVKVLGGQVTGVSTLVATSKVSAGTGSSATAPFNGTQATKTGTSSGTAGDICWDANYIYVCTASNTWKRSALTAF